MRWDSTPGRGRFKLHLIHDSTKVETTLFVSRETFT